MKFPISRIYFISRSDLGIQDVDRDLLRESSYSRTVYDIYNDIS